MEEIRQLYIMSSSQESEILENTIIQLYEFIDSNVVKDEQDIFIETIMDIMNQRQEHFFMAGFKSAVNLYLRER